MISSLLWFVMGSDSALFDRKSASESSRNIFESGDGSASKTITGSLWVNCRNRFPPRCPSLPRPRPLSFKPLGGCGDLRPSKDKIKRMKLRFYVNYCWPTFGCWVQILNRLQVHFNLNELIIFTELKQSLFIIKELKMRIGLVKFVTKMVTECLKYCRLDFTHWITLRANTHCYYSIKYWRNWWH